MDDATTWLDRESDISDLAVFLDFDGTMAPIVERPDEASPVDGIAELVEELAQAVPVAVISGRGLDDVRRRLGAREIYYAGSHGMEVRAPQGQRYDFEELKGVLPELDRREKWLRDACSEISGVEVERKRYGIAVHFRRNPEARHSVEELVNEAARGSGRLKVSSGKMVREVQPDVELDKGTALRYIRDKIDPQRRRRPIYIGDDRTDEDAFRVIADDGIAILVDSDGRDTEARYRLRDPEAVHDFLQKLVTRLASDEDARSSTRE